MVRLDDPRATLLNQPTKFGPGTVAIIASDLSRYTAFWASSLGMQFGIPPGSGITALVGSDISGARNEAIEATLAREDAEWVWFIDDDHEFPYDIVMQLLAHEVDIACPLVLRRESPFWPTATKDDNYLDLRDHRGDGGLLQVQFTGSSGMLIRRKVLEAMDGPWFDLGYDEQGRRVSEDVNFCLRAVEHGFPVHVDLGLTMSHMTTASIRPVWDEEREQWMTGFTIGDGGNIYMGIEAPPDPNAEPKEM